MASTLPPSVDCSPRRSRIPLALRAKYPSQTPVKVVRRKSSFIRIVDSSEDSPSIHDSIYEAGCFSSRSSDDDPIELRQLEILPDRNLRRTVHHEENNENLRVHHTVTKNQVEDDVGAQFIYGRGTVLNTITELSAKNSNATMRTQTRPKSMDDINSVFSKDHKRSFSVDDTTALDSFYHEAVSAIEGTPCQSFIIRDIYAEPKIPIQEPPKRPPTPPGMPSWTAHQTLPLRRSPCDASIAPRRSRRFLGLPASSISLSLSITDLNSRVRSTSAPQVQVAPRFRPPRSVYGLIDQHPFNRASISKVDQPVNTLPIMRPESPITSTETRSTFPRLAGRCRPSRQVRFTPSVTGQDPEAHSTQDRYYSPITPQRRSSIAAHLTVLPTLISSQQKKCPHHARRKPFNTAASTSPSRQHSTRLFQQGLFQQDSTASPSHLGIPWVGRSGRDDLRPNSPFDNDTTCNISITSTTDLVSDGLIDASPQSSPTRHARLIDQFPLPPISRPQDDSHPPLRCWRCKVQSIVCASIEKGRKWMKESRHCLILICCGYDCDDDSRPGSGFGWNGRLVDVEQRGPRNMTSAGYSRCQAPRESRKDVLHSTPVVSF